MGLLFYSDWREKYEELCPDHGYQDNELEEAYLEYVQTDNGPGTWGHIPVIKRCPTCNQIIREEE